MPQISEDTPEKKSTVSAAAPSAYTSNIESKMEQYHQALPEEQIPTDVSISRASPSMSQHSSSSSSSISVPVKKRRLYELKSLRTSTLTPETSPNLHRMEIEKNAAASALAALSSQSSSPIADNDTQPSLTSVTTLLSAKDTQSVGSTMTPIEKLSPLLPRIADGNASDSDLSSNGSLSSAGPLVPMPRAVHAPPVNRMMVDHTYTDYSVLNEDYLALYCGYSGEDGAAANGGQGAGTVVNEEDKRIQAKKMKKLKKIFRNMGQTRKNSGGVVQPFPAKLMEVLDRGDMEDSICWMPHGRAFAVLQPPVFVKEVLPRFFKQSKFMSFTRQLNLWGFKRITKGTDAGAYYHELFLRGRPRLCMMMRRQKIKGTGIKLTPNPDTEPNFYTISEDRPLPPPAKKDVMRPLPPLQQQTGMLSATAARRGLTQLSKRAGMRDPHSHILSGPSPNAAAGRFTQQPLGATKPHLLALAEARQQQQQQQQHAMQYPFASQHSSQLRGGFNTHPSQPGGSNTSPLLLNHLPNQDPAVSHHHNLLRSIPDTHHSAYHHHLSSPELPQRHQRQPTHFSDRQNVLYQEQRIQAEQQLRSERDKMHLNALLRERAAVEKEEQRYKAQAVMSAQELLYQVNGMVPDTQNTAATASTSVEELKHRLLVAARALEGAQQPSDGGGTAGNESLGGMMHGGVRGGVGLMRNGASAPLPPQQMQHRPMQAQQRRVNIPTLMSVLEQTQKVAAAAHEQSAILQRFAQDLNVPNSGGDTSSNVSGPGSYGSGSTYARY